MSVTTATLDLVTELASIAGAAAVSTAADDLAAYTVDGMTPTVVVSPSDEEQVAAILEWASEKGVAVIPWGGGTGMGLGNPPRAYDVVLRLEHLDQILEYEPADLTVTAQAGVTLAKLQAHLREAGQWLPLDPPDAGRATLGGIVACGASGPHRWGHGAPRDLLIGLRVAGADGLVFKGGAKVVKNVSGYDLPKLFTGSLGTLGVITEVSFKLQPLPKARGTLVAVYDRSLALHETLRGLLGSPLTAVTFELMNSHAAEAIDLTKLKQGNTYLLARFAGIAPAVERQLRDLEALSREAGAAHVAAVADDEEASLWAAAAELPRRLQREAEPCVLAKGAVLPMQVAAIVEAWEAAAAKAGCEAAVWARAGNGVVYALARGSDSQLLSWCRALRTIMEQLASPLILEEAPRAVKEGFSVWGEPDATLRVMRQIKEQYDPRSVLSPGRFMGGI